MNNDIYRMLLQQKQRQHYEIDENQFQSFELDETKKEM